MTDEKSYWMYGYKFLQNLPEGKNHSSNIILSSEINHNWIVFSKDDNLFIDHYGFRFYNDVKKRIWFFLSQEGKLKLKNFAIYTIRFYLDTTDKSIPDLLWKLEKQYDEYKMMFYVDFNNCSIISDCYDEKIITIDKRKHSTKNNLFLHLICSSNDLNPLFNLVKKSKYSEKDLEEFKTNINNKLNENIMFLVND